MKNDYSELIEYLDEKFGLVSSEINSVKGDVAELTGDVRDLQTKFDSLLTAVDGYAARTETYFQEFLALAHKVDRRWRSCRCSGSVSKWGSSSRALCGRPRWSAASQVANESE